MISISVPALSPVTFINPDSPGHQLGMLRSIYSDLGGRRGRTNTLPGQWLRFSHAGLTRDDLLQLGQGRVPQRFYGDQWQWLVRAVKADLIGQALRLAAERADVEGLSVADVVAVVGALCQCWNGPNPTIRRVVTDIAEAAPDSTEAAQDATGVPTVWNEYIGAKLIADEWGKGNLLKTARLRAWAASNPGPLTGTGIENQDAVCLKRVGDTIVFALSDGVGSSAGAGAAARLAVVTFSQNVARILSDGHDSSETAITQGLLAVHQAARRLAEDLVEEGRESKLLNVAPFLDPTTTLYFVRETLAGVIDRPALCTTLIGGMLIPDGDNWRLECVRVGDGILEVISPESEVSSLLTMIRNETSIGAVLSPVRNVKPSETEQVSKVLLPGSWVLVSSDGLPKGDSVAVWKRLGQFDSKLNLNEDARNKDAANLASELLERAAEVGRLDPSGNLFADNLSLILISMR